MRRLWRRLVIVLAVLGTAHLYLWWRLIAPLPSPWRGAGTVAVVALGGSLPVVMLAGRRWSRRRAQPPMLIAFLWFGLATYLLVAATLSHVAVAAGAAPVTAALVTGAAAALAVVVGVIHVARGPQVRRVEVRLPRLGVARYRVVQLSDVHIGPLHGRDFAARLVAQVNALAPDLIVITGDFVDGRLAELRSHVEPFRDLRARDGVYAVTGNHEYYWDAEPWVAHLRTLGIRYLRNQRVAIGDAFELAGTDDVTAHEDVTAATRGRDPQRPLVLLAHHPRTVARAAAAGVDLQLSGHTHGGQLLPPGYLARLFEPQVAGLGRFGATQLYVNPGTGYWGPPLRVGTTSEITELVLVR